MSSDWPDVKLEDVVSILGDGLHGTPNYDKNGEYYFINGNNLGDGKITIDEKTKRASKDEYFKHKKNLNDRTILVSINGTIGNVGLYNGEKVFLGKSACYFNVLEDVDKQFIRYVVTDRNFQNYINSLATGSTIKNVSLRLMRDYAFRLPPLNVQKQISKVLEDLDSKIELNRRMNETLEAIARAIFKSWFVDFDPVRAKASGEPPESICRRLRLTPDLLALFPDRLVDSQLGEIPEGWEVRGLDTIALLSTASTSPGKQPHEVFEHYSIPAFDFGTMPAYELGSTIKSNKYVASPNAVLVSKLNPETQRVWLPAVKTERAICSTEFMQFVPQLDYGRSYLYLMMCSEPMQVEILKRVTGSTGSRQRAQPSQITTLPIVVPAEKVVRSFESFVTPVLVDTVANLDQSQTLASLRDTLLPKLLSGELHVNHLNNILEEEIA
jgi:type I restriction enzyme S subunit